MDCIDQLQLPLSLFYTIFTHSSLSDDNKFFRILHCYGNFILVINFKISKLLLILSTFSVTESQSQVQQQMEEELDYPSFSITKVNIIISVQPRFLIL